MKVILYMAMSLNGMVARENNEEDFITDESWSSFVELTQKTGCLIWGRKTLEIVKGWDETYINQLKNVKQIIVSRQGMVTSPKKALEILKNEGYEQVILCGGPTLNSSFAKENLINEIIFNVEPVVIGKGLSVFLPQEFDLNLKLKTINKISENLIQLNYIVNFV